MSANIGTGEIIVILIVALLVVGPDKLPKLARAFGKAVNKFKSYMDDVTDELNDAGSEYREISNDISELRTDIKDTLKKTAKSVDEASSSAERKHVEADEVIMKENKK